MKKPKRKSGDKPGASEGDGADGDDHLWLHTAASVKPLRRGKPRVHASQEKKEAGTRPAQKAAEKHAPAAFSAPASLKNKPTPPPQATLPKAKAAEPPPMAQFDRSSARKIRSGQKPIEARVDLHGMRQDEAHGELRAFLHRCQARGLRYVLVITGKGKASTSSDDMYVERERGVLRRNVPRWLEEPDLRRIVVSFATAAIQHGGEGAIYIQLRMKHRA